MKHIALLTIAVPLVVMIVCAGRTSATPLGTEYTYQGRLMNSENWSNGQFDFEFMLFDQAAGGIQAGSTCAISDVEVLNGYFTVQLDFGGEAFNGEARWLRVGVRPHETTEPFTVLNPRQEVTPTPYALQTRGIFVNNLLNVGIGTTNPLSKLSAGGDGFVNTGVYGNGSDYGLYGNSDTYGVFGRGSYSGVHGRDDDSGSFGRLGYDTCGVYGSGTVYGGYFLGQGYFSGQVGIGNTNPEAPLDVNGNVKASGSVDSPGAIIEASNAGNGYGVRGESAGRAIYGLATGNSGIGIYGDATFTGSGTNYGGFFQAAGEHGQAVHGINSSSVNQGYIGGEDYGVYGEHHNGNYGYIGNVYDGVYGHSSSGQGVHGYSGTGKGVYGVSQSGVGVYGESNWYAGWFEGTIRVDGDIQYTGVLSYQSDRRLKENILPLSGALEKVSSITGVYFNFKKKTPDDREVGVIAQDVEKVLPELVSADEKGYLSVDYSKLTPVLVEAVKELKAENDLLKQRLEAQEKLLHQIQEAVAQETAQ